MSSISCSKLKLRHHRYICIHPAVLIHKAQTILADFVVLTLISWKWISPCTQRQVCLCTTHDWAILHGCISVSTDESKF